MKKKLLKISTIPMSLDIFCKGQLKMLNDHYDVVAISSPDEELKWIEEREGVRTIPLKMARNIELWTDIKALWKMIGVMRKEKPYIVHSMTPKAGLISMLAAKICGVPVRMHTYTGLVFPTATGMKQKVLIWMDKLLCACATYINPEGKGVADDLRSYMITKKPLHIIGNGNVRGIDADYWNRNSCQLDESKSINKGNGQFTFIFVGRMVGDKGINELVEAFKRLSNVRLLLVGPMEENLDPLKEETIHEINNNPNIDWLGLQQDVRPYYLQADAFVFPSYREGFPNTVLEAGAMGLPAIVTNINGANEIIVPNENGIIIPSKDAVALYSAMKYMIDHPNDVKHMAVNARRMILERYEQKYIWAELLKVYQSLAS
ncbi:MAG: glycosyltransferase family 4 protein [Prevotella sp.]|nr:glycosyltransferase family 4 protein [Prevotella sp.]